MLPAVADPGRAGPLRGPPHAWARVELQSKPLQGPT